jgi:hypothetical protein
MSIEQLKLMVYDMFEMDLYIPESTFYKSDFKKASYTVWAVDELEDYILRCLYPRTSGSIDECIKIIEDFASLMNRYSKFNSYTEQMFSVARDIATDIREMLLAMR